MEILSGRKQDRVPLPPSAPKGSVRMCFSSKRSSACSISGAAAASTINTGRPLACSRRRLPVSISAEKELLFPNASVRISTFQRKRMCVRRRRKHAAASMHSISGSAELNSRQNPAAAAVKANRHSAACRFRRGRRSPVAMEAARKSTGRCSKRIFSIPTANAAAVHPCSNRRAASRRPGCSFEKHS